jgi:hypothetical protein
VIVSKRLTGFVVLAGLAALAVLLLTQRRGEAPSVAGAADETPAMQAVSPSVAREEARNAPAAACPDPQLTITMTGSPRKACVGTLDVTQNGSVRSYRVTTIDEPRQTLRIDAAGTMVIAAQLGDFECREAACMGISISRHDVQGIRTITLSSAILKHGADATTIDGKLRTLPEEQVMPCEGQGVSVVTSDSSTSSFCPQGGAGFEIGNDGARTYRFTNLDGESILVAVDDAERVKRVTYEGESTLACTGAACSVRISAPDSAGARTFTFGGTTVIDTTSGQRNAVLNGTLVLPPL